MRARLALRSDSAELERLLRFAGEFAGHAALTEDERARLLIILDELFSNIVTHGYDVGTTDGEVEVTLAVRDNRLLIEFVDDGRAFDPLGSTPPDLDLPAAERPIGGLGIAIVRALADAASYARQGGRNRLSLARDLTRSPPASG